MARRKQTAKEQAQGLGCLMLIGLVAVIYATSNRGGASSATLSARYGEEIDVADERVIMPKDVPFYQCPQLRCNGAGVVEAGQSIVISKMVAGEIVNGLELWVVGVDSDGNQAYAPIADVYPPDATATATRSVTNTPRPSIMGATNTPRPTVTNTSTPTPLATESSSGDVMDYDAVMYTNANAIVRACASVSCQNLGRVDAGQVVTVTGMMDGEAVEAGYTIWYRVSVNGTTGFIYQRLLASDAPVMVATDAPTNGNVSPTMFVCPRNCDEAVARGMGASEIAQLCPRLDRDKDGQACYGD